MKTTVGRKLRIKKKVRSRIAEVSTRPRLTVFRSNKHLYAQVIDDIKRITLVSVSDYKDSSEKKLAKQERAVQLGGRLGERLKEQKITRIVFDRGHYKYGGRVKAFCEAVRAAGITI